MAYFLPPAPDGAEEPDVEDAFGEHDIEYWVWSGSRLVPATTEQVAAIREHEALCRLPSWASRQQERDHTAPGGMRFAWAHAWLRTVVTRFLPGRASRPGPASSARAPAVGASAQEWEHGGDPRATERSAR